MLHIIYAKYLMHGFCKILYNSIPLKSDRSFLQETKLHSSVDAEHRVSTTNLSFAEVHSMHSL